MHTLLPLFVITGVAAADTPKPDLKTALMDADRAFAKATADKGLDGWVGFMTADVAKSRKPGEKLVVGTEAVRKADAELFADKSKKLVWEPVDAHAYADGKTGVTSGRYKVVGTDKDGKESVLGAGGYVTVWRLEVSSPEVPAGNEIEPFASGHFISGNRDRTSKLACQITDLPGVFSSPSGWPDKLPFPLPEGGSPR